MCNSVAGGRGRRSWTQREAHGTNTIEEQRAGGNGCFLCPETRATALAPAPVKPQGALSHFGLRERGLMCAVRAAGWAGEDRATQCCIESLPGCVSKISDAHSNNTG